MFKLIGHVTCALFVFHIDRLAAECYEGYRNTSPTSNFEVRSDGTAIDYSTGLMWKRCLEGQSWSNGCVGDPAPYDWKEALQVPMNLNVGGGFVGYTDWRLPSIKELMTLSNLACYKPAINTEIFLFPANLFQVILSSTPVRFVPQENEASRVYAFNLNEGSTVIPTRDAPNSVLLVRSHM